MEMLYLSIYSVYRDSKSKVDPMTCSMCTNSLYCPSVSSKSDFQKKMQNRIVMFVLLFEKREIFEHTIGIMIIQLCSIVCVSCIRQIFFRDSDNHFFGKNKYFYQDGNCARMKRSHATEKEDMTNCFLFSWNIFA